MNESPSQKKILLALPDNWQIELQHFLSSKGLQVVPAATFEAALEIVQTQDFQGMIIVSDWLSSMEGKNLVDKALKAVPVLMLIRGETDYTWFNQLYQPGFREYCTIPLDFDELNLFLKRIGIVN